MIAGEVYRWKNGFLATENLCEVSMGVAVFELGLKS